MRQALWLPAVAVGLALAQNAGAASSNFTFDGSSSDMAQQFRNLHDAGFNASALSLSPIPSDITERLSNYLLEFADLPPLLQRALLWDSGYVAAYGDDTKFSTIYTLCDKASTMADIALSLEQYEKPGCGARTCTDPSDNVTATYRSLTCTGTQMASVSLCAATDVVAPLRSSMWATGGNDSLLPVPSVVRHNWTDSGENYLIYAIHMVNPDHTYDSCPTEATDSAMIIPCVAYSNTTNSTDWCRPSTGSLVDSWLLEEAALGSSSESATMHAASGTSPLAATKSRSAPSLTSVLKGFVESGAAYDGTSSDLAKQYLSRYAAGDVVDQLQFASADLSSDIQQRLTALGLKFEDLDGLLQRALIWDSGYAVAAADNTKLVKVYTESGRSMADIAISQSEYENGGCSITTCADDNGGYSNRSEYCTGDQMKAMVYCATEDVADSGVNLSMWSDGGSAVDVPKPEVIRHYWTDNGSTYLIYAIHTTPSTNEPAWGSCSVASGYYGAMIVPCRPYSNISDTANWATPAKGALVQAWLEQTKKDSKSRFKWWYILLIILLLLLLLAVIWCCCCKRRRRSAASSNQEVQPIVVVSPKGDSSDQDYVLSEGDTKAGSSMAGAFATGSTVTQKEHATAWDAVRLLHEDPIVAGSRIPLEELQFNRVLSKGAFGEVWLGGYQQSPVAIKKLLASRQQFECVQGFIEEIKLTSSLDHPNIVQYIGVAWKTLESLCMVMEYLVMGDLHTYLEHNNRTLTWNKDKYPIALGTASAITYLHSRRPAPLIHRDIKAKNILLTQQLQPKLIDFGVSRDLVEETMTAGVGTPYWAAPEVLEGSRYTEQSDIYSFGIFLSELDTGSTPFKDIRSKSGARLSAFQIINLVLEGKIEPEITPNCPVPISVMIKECLRLDPSQRPTATELVARLNNSTPRSPANRTTISYRVQSSATPGNVEQTTRTIEGERKIIGGVQQTTRTIEGEWKPIGEAQQTTRVIEGSRTTPEFQRTARIIGGERELIGGVQQTTRAVEGEWTSVEDIQQMTRTVEGEWVVNN